MPDERRVTNSLTHITAGRAVKGSSERKQRGPFRDAALGMVPGATPVVHVAPPVIGGQATVRRAAILSLPETMLLEVLGTLTLAEAVITASTCRCLRLAVGALLRSVQANAEGVRTALPLLTTH